jgi:hypothetical protein
MNTATRILIDTTTFERVGKEGRVPKRVPVPLDVQSLVSASLPYDPRKQGERPTTLDIYTQLIDLGLDAYITDSAEGMGGSLIHDPFGLTDDQMATHETDDVLWIQSEVNAGIKEMLDIVNVYRLNMSQKRIRSVVPIVCALIRKGVQVSLSNQ